MTITRTPLGLHQPTDDEMVKKGAQVISHNAGVTDTLLGDTRNRVGGLEAERALDPGLIEDPDHPGLFFLAPDTTLAPDNANPGFYLLPGVESTTQRIVTVGPDGVLPLSVTLAGYVEPTPGGGGASFPEGPLPTTSLTAGTNLVVRKVDGVWPARPTDRADITVTWVGADPDPAIVSSGTGGALNNVDLRMVV